MVSVGTDLCNSALVQKVWNSKALGSRWIFFRLSTVWCCALGLFVRMQRQVEQTRATISICTLVTSLKIVSTAYLA